MGGTGYVGVVDLARAEDIDIEGLLNPTGPGGHEDHAVAEGDGFADVVGDEEDGGSDLLLETLEFEIEVFAGEGVEGGEGFVHEKHARLEDERAGKSDTLAHTAGELVDRPVFETAEADFLQHLLGFVSSRRGRHVGLAEAEFDVLLDGEPGEERAVLEDKASVWAGALDLFPIDENFSPIRGLQSGDEVEEGRFAAARGADEHDQFAGLDGEVDVFKGLDAGFAGVEPLPDAPNFEATAHL